MSYRNPSSTVDTTLGDAFIKQIKGVSSGISETMSKYATMAAANKQRNFELTKKINQYESEVSSNVAKVATENKVNSESLLSGLEPRTKEFKEWQKNHTKVWRKMQLKLESLKILQTTN